MPRSRSKRRRYQPPPKPKPPPSPPWIPVLVFGFIILGFLVILGRYVLSTSVNLFNNNWVIGAGLACIAAGFGVATRWR
ncbi:MAG: cell division protein CrgA [Actinomycetota bacterium]